MDVRFQSMVSFVCVLCILPRLDAPWPFPRCTPPTPRYYDMRHYVMQPFRVHIWQLCCRLQSRTNAHGSVAQIVSLYSGFAIVVGNYGNPGGPEAVAHDVARVRTC